MLYLFHPADEQFRITFSRDKPKTDDPETSGDPSHNALADFYHEKMAQALQDLYSKVLLSNYNQAVGEWASYSPQPFPNGIPNLDFYKAVAWVGMGYTVDLSDSNIEKWNMLNDALRTRIEDNLTRSRAISKTRKK